MRAGLGCLGWSPDVFWQSTPLEIRRAIEGLAMQNGTDPDTGLAADSGYMTPEEYQALKDAAEETLAESMRRAAELQRDGAGR